MSEYVLDEAAVQAAAKKQGLGSMARLASRLGVHRNTLRSYLSGEKQVFSDFMLRLAEGLEVDALTLVRRRTADSSTSREYRAIVALAQALAEEHAGLAFGLIGSRAADTAGTYSDWDVAVTGGRHELDSDLYLELRGKIEDECDDFSRCVDLVNLDAAPVSFLAGITYRPQFLAGSLESFSYMLGVLDGVRRKV